MEYKIASLDSKQYDAVKKAEKLMEEEKGKEYVMIAWEKDK